MPPTPEFLVRDYSIEAESGQKAVPRVLFALREDLPHKAKFLTLAISMIVHGALPEYGGAQFAEFAVREGSDGSPARLRPAPDVPQKEIAGGCGLARESLTRRLDLFSTQIEVDEEQRRRRSEKEKQRAGARGYRISHRGHGGEQGEAVSGAAMLSLKSPAGLNEPGHSGSAPPTESSVTSVAKTVRWYESREEAEQALPELQAIAKYRDATLEVLRGKRIRPGGPRPRPNPTVLLHRKKRYGAPNAYNFAFPSARQNAARPWQYRPASIEDLAQHEQWGALFDPELMTERKASGHRQEFKFVMHWLWDHRLPYTDTARLVMTYFFFCGLLTESESTHRPRGYADVRQSTVARMCGLSERTVRRAYLQLEGKTTVYSLRHRGKVLDWFTTRRAARHAMRRQQKAGHQHLEIVECATPALVRVAHAECRDTAAGKRRGPSRILYLPLMLLDGKEAEAEAGRFAGVLIRVSRPGACDLASMGGHWALQQAAEIHRELLASWTDKEHGMPAFRHEARRRMLAGRIPRKLVRLLVPLIAIPGRSPT